MQMIHPRHVTFVEATTLYSDWGLGERDVEGGRGYTEKNKSHTLA